MLGISLAERTKRLVLMTSLGMEIAGRAQTVLRDAEELSSILHLIILSDGKPGHRMSF